MSLTKQKRIITRNGLAVQKVDNLQDALANCKRMKLNPKHIVDEHYTIYGWAFGNDDYGYYFYRLHDEREQVT